MLDTLRSSSGIALGVVSVGMLVSGMSKNLMKWNCDPMGPVAPISVGEARTAAPVQEACHDESLKDVLMQELNEAALIGMVSELNGKIEELTGAGVGAPAPAAQDRNALK